MKALFVGLLSSMALINMTLAAESMEKGQLDLSTYTCEQFNEHVEKQNQIAMIATVWANGYRVGVLGLEEMPLLEPKVVETDIYGLQNLCNEHPQATFVKTLQDVLQKQLEENKHP